MMTRNLVMPLLGVLLWVISIHVGTFATATLLPHPLTGFERKEFQNNIHTPHMKITEQDLNRSVAFGNGVINRMLRLETNLGWSNVHVKKGTPSHGQLIVSSPEEEALRQGRDALVATKATIHLMNTFCNEHNLSPSECSKYISSYSLTSTPLESSCKNLRRRCSQEEILSQYRSADGTCNHKTDGSRGSSFTAYRRLLHPDYLDGVHEPRRSINKKSLPSPRLVSSNLVKKLGEGDQHLTLAVVLWSKFIEYDLSHTAASKMIHTENSIECCAASGNHLSPRYTHPFCAPIDVPWNDKYYAEHSLDCMTYVRSVAAFRADCSFGPVDQVNQATHYLDGSQIYGSTKKKSDSLRSFVDGQMKTSVKNKRLFLPISQKPTDDCQVSDAGSSCFIAGDSRVNVYPQVTAMYTIWLREHNRIAKELSKLNPTWDDEVLYQEARRIVTAEMQHITYNEWIPLVLGKKYSNKIGNIHEYNENVNPSVSNSFGTAAVRALNSLLDGNLKLYHENRLVNSTIELRNYFNKPNVVEEPGYLDALIRGMSTQSSQKLDLRFAEDISSYLFSNGNYGFDVFSLDIQRGRDHGLPTYTAYRTLCGLPPVTTFDDLLDAIPPTVVNSLSSVYQSPHDVDLLVGGISERPIEGSLFGPTFSCIIADQFLRTRRGDRYFYANEKQPEPFSRSQLRELEKVTLARIFCDNADDIKKMQQNVFKQITNSNELINCEAIPRLNLRLWMDARGKYY